MILLIDQGNSRTKWRVAEATGKNFVAGGAWSGDAPGPDDLAAMACSGPVTALSVATVVAGGRRQRLADVLNSLTGIPPRWVTVSSECGGVRNGYREAMRLGVDRWMALLGARAMGDGAWLVVDAGTALTVDALAGDGRHLGGYIVPGISMQARALSMNTSAIGVVESSDGHGWGRSTSEAVSRGVLFSVAAFVNRASVELTSYAEDTCRVIVTGGDAGLLLPWLKGVPQLEPDLVFIGMLVEARENLHGPG